MSSISAIAKSGMVMPNTAGLNSNIEDLGAGVLAGVLERVTSQTKATF